MQENWQKRRSVFNHDWLKNQFMPALAKLINIIDHRVRDDNFVESFLTLTLPVWEPHLSELMSILRDFENEMSPRRLFDRLPLSGCSPQTREWLASVTHSLWLRRKPVDQWIAEAIRQAEMTNSAYIRIRQKLQNGVTARTVGSLQPIRSQFAEFRDCCEALASAISQFPREVDVA